MFRVDIREAKANFLKYVPAAARGESVVICRRNHPVAELRALPQPRTKPRPIGLAPGQFKVPRSFFEPLPQTIVAAFR